MTSGAAPVTECDHLAALPGAAPAGLRGVVYEALDTARAISACRDAVAHYPTELRFQVWLGRTLNKAERYAEGRQFYEKAAEKGFAAAINGLGAMHERGQGMPQSYAKARALFEKAAAGSACGHGQPWRALSDWPWCAKKLRHRAQLVEKAAEKRRSRGNDQSRLALRQRLWRPESYVSPRLV